MSVEIKTKGDVLSAFISGELDHHSAPQIRKVIDSAIDVNMPSLLVLDFSGVGFMDSSGIGLIMGRFAKLNARKGKIHIANPSPHIYKILKLTGMERLATIDNIKEEKQ